MYIRLSPYNIDVAASTVSLYMYSFCGTDAFEKACWLIPGQDALARITTNPQRIILDLFPSA